MNDIDKQQLQDIIEDAKVAAFDAAEKFFSEQLGGRDQYACGFAWTSLYEYNGKKIDGRSKIGKLLKACGVDQSYTRTFQIWNPSGFPAQNVDTLLAGAEAAARVFREHGFTASAGSRLD